MDTIKSFSGLRELALFAGAGGGILGGHSLGWRTVCAVEYEQYPQASLCARQNDKSLEPFPIWDDVRTFDGKPWRGIIDVVSGGFPCQDISCAGKGAGIEDGARSGLWREMARIICEVRPRFVFVENSPMLVSRGLGLVLGDLAEMGYDAEWGVLGASDVGANHKRERMWILGVLSNTESYGSRRNSGELQSEDEREAEERQEERIREPVNAGEVSNANNNGQLATEIRRGVISRSNDSASRQDKAVKHSGLRECGINEPLANSATDGPQTTRTKQQTTGTSGVCSQFYDTESAGFTPCYNETHGRNGRPLEKQSWRSCLGGFKWWTVEPNVGRVANAVAARVDRLKAIGNGQVPLVASRAFCELYERLMTGVVKW